MLFLFFIHLIEGKKPVYPFSWQFCLKNRTFLPIKALELICHGIIILRMKNYIFMIFTVEMMRSSLITILLSSEKRTDLLLLLKEKPRTIEEINNELDTNSVAILPQLKRLKENGLVVQEDRIYDLSLLGRIIVRKMESLVKAFRHLEDNYD